MSWPPLVIDEDVPVTVGRALRERGLSPVELVVCALYVERPGPKPETLIWNDAAQALIHGFRPAGFSLGEIRHTLGLAASTEPGEGTAPAGPPGSD